MERAIRSLMGANLPPRFKFKDTYASIEVPTAYEQHLPTQQEIEDKFDELETQEEAVEAAATEATVISKFDSVITSNLEVGTSNLFVDTETGRVGIGTTNPQSKLTIESTNGNHLRLNYDNLWYNTIERDSSGDLNFREVRNGGTDNILMTIKTQGNVGIGQASPSYKLDVNGGVRITGGLLISSVGTETNPIVDLRELYGKASGNYYVRFFNGTISQHYWDGMWLKIHDEGLNAHQYTSYWSHSTTQQMSNFGGLGSGYGHGWDVTASTDLTVSNLPPHSFARYSVKWHFVDSVDREANYLQVYDFRSYNQRENMWYGTRNISDSGMNTRTLYHHTSASFTAATYSYEPWNGAGTTTMGYETIDTGPMPHFSSRFKVRHYTATNQAISDEAIYYTHSTIWIR